MEREQLENPVLAYVVIAAAFIVGLLSATVFAENSDPINGRRAVAKSCNFAQFQEPDQPDPQATQGVKPCLKTRQWILGVQSTPTSAGCVVSAVIEGSAAERAGLVVGDRVIAIDGEQVGWIGRRLAPLSDAVDASCSRSPRLLIQRAKTGAVHSLPVQLDTISECLGH